MTRADSQTRRAAVSLYALVVGINISVGTLNALLPVVRDNLSMSPSQMGAVIAAFGVARLLCDLPFGRVLTRLGPRYTLMIAVGGISGGAAVMLVGTSYGFFVLGRGLAGIGSSAAFVVALSVLGRAHVGRAALSLSLYEIFGLFGLGLSSGIAGVAASIGHWRGAFAVGVVSPWLAGILAIWNLPASLGERERAPGRQLDPDAQSAGWRVGLLFTAFVLGVLWYGERTAVAPLFAADVVGLPASTIGWLIGVGFFASMGSLVSIGLSARSVAPLSLLKLGLVLAAVASLASPLARTEIEFAAVHLGLAFGLGVWSIPGALIVSGVDDRFRAIVAARYRVAVDLGITFGPVLMIQAVARLGFTMAFVLAGTAAFTAVVALANESAEKPSTG